MKTDSLEQKLNEYKKQFLNKADAAKIEAYEQGIKSVLESGILEKALKAKDKAPDFKLKNARNELVRLSDFTQQGPVILTWYRGGWCPYCNLTLKSLQQTLPEFKKAGAQLIALTPELSDNSI